MARNIRERDGKKRAKLHENYIKEPAQKKNQDRNFTQLRTNNHKHQILISPRIP